MKNNLPKTLRTYTSPSGKAPFSTWLNSIKDRTMRARIRRRLDMLEIGQYGDLSL